MTHTYFAIGGFIVGAVAMYLYKAKMIKELKRATGKL